jgi:BlaI family transcriptional regulator, penicillinase repressor
MKKAINISAAESQIMQALWRKSPLTPEEIIAAAGPPNGWADGTVRTLITRLLRKKALVGARKDGVYLYRPLIARADYVQAESQSLLDRLFQGQVAPLVAHFAEARALTAKDIQKLKKLIAELEDDHD